MNKIIEGRINIEDFNRMNPYSNNANGLAYNNLFNTMGIGNPMPAAAAGQTGQESRSGKVGFPHGGE